MACLCARLLGLVVGVGVLVGTRWLEMWWSFLVVNWGDVLELMGGRKPVRLLSGRGRLSISRLVCMVLLESGATRLEASLGECFPALSRE